MKKGNISGLMLLLGLTFSLIAVQSLLIGTANAQSYDVNDDGDVDINDIIIWSLSFGTFEGEDGFNSAVDVHEDGVIDLLDAILISINFG